MPIRQRRVKSEYKPSPTNEIKQMSYHRYYLKKISIKLRSTKYDKAYKRCKHNLMKGTNANANAKLTKKVGKLLNELLNKKSKATQVKELDINGQLITVVDKIADDIINFFFYSWK